MSRPVNRTALREENLPAPASRAVIASAATGPDAVDPRGERSGPARFATASRSWRRTSWSRVPGPARRPGHRSLRSGDSGPLSARGWRL